MKKKKLLLVGSNSVHIYNYNALIKDFFEEIILVTDPGELLSNECPTFQLDFSLRNPLKTRKNIHALKEIIIHHKPDIIHVLQANSYSYITLKAANKNSIPIIVTALGSDILLVPYQGLLYKRMTKYVLSNAKYFTADSIYVATEMQHLISPKKINVTVANFGIDLFGPVIDKENIIYSNRLHKKMYRIDAIIKAFKKFISHEEKNFWKLIIAGSGEETNALKNLAKTLQIEKNIEFVGWLSKEKNDEYYSRAKIYVSIPESDATSISLLEAMDAGCIPVLSDLPANKEWITDGLNGIIVNDIEKDFFSDISIINTKKTIEINKELTLTKGSKDVNRRIFIDLYEQILDNK